MCIRLFLDELNIELVYLVKSHCGQVSSILLRAWIEQRQTTEGFFPLSRLTGIYIMGSFHSQAFRRGLNYITDFSRCINYGPSTLSAHIVILRKPYSQPKHFHVRNIHKYLSTLLDIEPTPAITRPHVRAQEESSQTKNILPFPSHYNLLI